ncbi:hypothetical protein IscW_ISCW008903 [Ixodes scapularis]|uniref:Uncharacterized protein n=1 Tax=Ixodes scapularis TaxID=6945 RepID=B7PZJ8_IXOSC|nr:hypothetical protein IscW_ISCW008903 [Ixodes scapularis]|eukprot:XP_002405316.1 hypothetical protein IscW_ISCW008903 [Ixodes scapularis]
MSHRSFCLGLLLRQLLRRLVIHFHVGVGPRIMIGYVLVLVTLRTRAADKG